MISVALPTAWPAWTDSAAQSLAIVGLAHQPESSSARSGSGELCPFELCPFELCPFELCPFELWPLAPASAGTGASSRSA
jgi:hypothetical protein